MSDAANREENRDVAVVVIAGVLVAISLAVGLVVWLIKNRMEQTFKELGVQLPGITIFALDHPLINGMVIAVLAGCAVMIAIKELRMIGLCSWIVVLLLYLGFWALALGLPFVPIERLGEHTSSL